MNRARSLISQWQVALGHAESLVQTAQRTITFVGRCEPRVYDIWRPHPSQPPRALVAQIGHLDVHQQMRPAAGRRTHAPAIQARSQDFPDRQDLLCARAFAIDDYSILITGGGNPVQAGSDAGPSAWGLSAFTGVRLVVSQSFAAPSQHSKEWLHPGLQARRPAPERPQRVTLAAETLC